MHNGNNIHCSTEKQNTRSACTTKKWTMNEVENNAKLTFMQTKNITCKKRMKANELIKEDYSYMEKKQMNWKKTVNVNEFMKAEYSCIMTVKEYVR